MADVIGSVVISLSRCCLPNDQGPFPPSPQNFYLEPPLLEGRVNGTVNPCIPEKLHPGHV